MMLVIHASKCLNREMEQGGSSRLERQCRVEHCNIMKFIFRHTARCKNRGSCTMGPNCYYTNKLMEHMKDCNDRENCPLCLGVVREMGNEERRTAAQNNRSSLGSTSGLWLSAIFMLLYILIIVVFAVTQYGSLESYFEVMRLFFFLFNK